MNGSCLFVSDIHFNVPQEKCDREREHSLVALLKKHAKIDNLFLLGDVFDFWFEYRDVIPRGYYNFFHQCDKMLQGGTKIHFFTGNHDMWAENFFTDMGMEIYRRPQVFDINGKKFMVGHGDGVGGKQSKYLLIKWIFNFKPNRWLYSTLHPRISFAIARHFSHKSRESHTENDKIFCGESEHQVVFARKVLENQDINFFIFGHRHIPVKYSLTENSLFFNTGDWISNYSYVMSEDNKSEPELVFFNTKDKTE